MKHISQETGAVNALLVGCIVLALISTGLAGFGVYAFGNYLDQRDNTTAKINAAVTEAKTAQKTELEKDFAVRYEQPHTKFNGPSDLGSITFDYPKTWSVYQAASGSDGEYIAYFNPVIVPQNVDGQKYALRLVVKSQSYNSTVSDYNELVKEKQLTSTPLTVNGFTGVRLEGKFSETRSGSAVLFKVRDKTLILSTDTSTFLDKFNDVVLKSLDFNP